MQKEFITDLDWAILFNAKNQYTKNEKSYLSLPLVFKNLNLECRIAIDWENNKHFLIEQSQDKKIIEDRKSKRIQIIKHSLLIGDLEKRFIDIVCRENKFDFIFSNFINTLIMRIDNCEKQNINTECINHLEEWRTFFKKSNKMLSKSKMVGLFGELYIINKFLKKNKNIINQWTGPNKARFDFEFSDICLEIKTTSSRRGLSFEIHGLKQLEPPINKNLYLIAIIVEISPDGISIPDMIKEICNQIVDPSNFYHKLHKIGYYFDLQDEYNEFKFRIEESEEYMYLVNKDFPKIIKDDFITGELPNGVVDINYTIDITQKPPYPLSNQDVTKLIQKIIDD